MIHNGIPLTTILILHSKPGITMRTLQQLNECDQASGPTCWKKNRAWFKLLKSKKIGVTNGNLNMELVP